MKKLMLFASLGLLALSLVGCGMGSQKTEEITDEAIIAEMDAIVSENVEHYFGLEVDPTVERKYQALKTFVQADGDSKEFVHKANIFQALSEADPEVGELHGYGGILDPIDQSIKGLIINIYHERGEGKSYTDGQLTEIASRFLKEKELVQADEELRFAGYNGKANTDSLKVVIIEGQTAQFAVGIDTIMGNVVYFEIGELPPADATTAE